MQNTTTVLKKPLVVNMTMNDIDELTVRMAGWENDWRQIDAGRALNQIKVVAGHHTVVQHVQLSHSVHQQGKTPDHLMTFGFPNRPSEMMWNGRSVSCPAMFDFNGLNGYDAVSGTGFQGVTVSIPTGNFLRIAESLDVSVSDLCSNNIPRLLSGDNHALIDFRRYLYRLSNCLTDIKNPRSRHNVTIELDEKLPLRLLTALAQSRSDMTERPLIARQVGLRIVIDYMEENCRENPNILEICKATGLSWRSLDRVFQEYFGVGPKRYFLNLRLTNVRRSLKSARPGVKIVDAANDWGFWHMGDFAREYRQMFSELPSKTLMQRGR